jgi:hypothetical protein
MPRSRMSVPPRFMQRSGGYRVRYSGEDLRYPYTFSCYYLIIASPPITCLPGRVGCAPYYLPPGQGGGRHSRDVGGEAGADERKEI